MDVSIAVSLIRGQMGAVVERAVNGAVETVLAEMLKVVGVKFEELKVQVSALKRDMSALQREKAAKEKENDKIRAMLRYTELKLKYYRQSLEGDVRSPPHCHSQARPPRVNITVSSAETASFSGSVPTGSGPARASHGEPPQPRGKAMKPDLQAPDAAGDLDVVPPQPAPTPHTNSPSAPEKNEVGVAAPLGQGSPEVQDCEWTISLQPEPTPLDSSPAPDQPAQADSSTRASCTPLLQVKQEQEVICIKEEPEEEQEVMATLLLDCEVQGQLPGSEGQRSTLDWSGQPVPQRNPPDAPPNYRPVPPPPFSLPQLVPVDSVQAGVPPRQAVRSWPKDLSLYEEYKLRRNELRRRSLNRRREMEKSLPQPLLADLVRERREKTRLRVARWRAKRKLQACLMNQAQAETCGAGPPQQHFDMSTQQQLRGPPVDVAPSAQRRRPSMPHCSFLTSNSGFAPLPFISSSSSSLLMEGHNMADHVHQQAVSSSQPVPAPPQHSLTLMDTDIFQ